MTPEQEKIANDLVAIVKRSGISISTTLDRSTETVNFILDEEYISEFPKAFLQSFAPFSQKHTLGLKFEIPVRQTDACLYFTEFCRIAIKPPKPTDNSDNRLRVGILP